MTGGRRWPWPLRWWVELLRRLFGGPPGPPGSIEFIRWRASREEEEEAAKEVKK